jgi:DNA mismatch repair ATPase MutS
MEIYSLKSKKYSEELSKINKNYNSISLLRLFCIFFFLLSVYYYSQNNIVYYILLAGFFFFSFIFLMRFHSQLDFRRKIKKALIQINEDEMAYLKRENIPFENGEEFQDFQHPYAYDLDIFGAHSLFQNLNRTATFIGKKKLAGQLLSLLPESIILDNQKAIKELAEAIEWRQDFLALAKLTKDKKSVYERLLQWSQFPSVAFSKTNGIISFMAPLLLILAFVGYLITSNPVFLSYLSFLFVFNLAFLGLFLKQIKTEIAHAENIDAIISQYSLLVQKIEQQNFQSEKLIALQQKLKHKNVNASIHLKSLAGLFSKMDSIGNFVTAIIFNGIFLFNIQVLKSLIRWKKEYKSELENWLEVIGEFEMLNSLANFSYNNPEFVFPKLNADYQIDFANLSHPLLNPNSRVGNSVTFQPQYFMILTGSNMSGKSTFLRSIGINMVLTGMGSAVCASQANVHPLPVLVSMRLSDSLSDSESYFFAEIKRLKQIMDVLQTQPAFVLLDEILRGTNSEDKRNGTIEVVKKVIAKKAIGAIATHDIEVCLTTNDYPEKLTNKCFEVEILEDELYFDYKLRDGICKNKSATFLMQKMGVI